MQLPIFPKGATHITSELAFKAEDGQVTYLNGSMPVFMHDEDDTRTFRMITSQFCVNGNAKQSEIAKAFGVTPISVRRGVKLFREQGAGGFYAPRRTRGAAVLTPPVLEEAQRRLDEGASVAEVAEALDIKRNTLAKAVRDGRLHTRKPSKSQSMTKSARSVEDSEAAMGMGATNTLGRVAASMGLVQGIPFEFQRALDVVNGGVLLALPALLAVGLLRHTDEHFSLPRGYYRLDSLFLLLAFMALVRLTSIESLRYSPPGEWGKLLGLDRIPEVRTLRDKLKHLSSAEQPAKWSAELCRDWMEGAPDEAGMLYVDGHVRVYHGNQTKLPRHYVSRQRLCLRATVDYWVNAMDGQPFFRISKTVDPGLIKVLEQDIVPRLEQDVPNQPTADELEADPNLHRFTLVYDREGYSPGLLLRMKKRRIACLTYHKFPKDQWADEEFHSYQVSLGTGEVIQMDLAERGTYLGSKPGERLWVREIRKRTKSGGQTSILATDYQSELAPIAAGMLSRWCQENFFRYMRIHYGLDRIIDYSTEEIPDTTTVVNPAHRELDGLVRKKIGILNRLLAEFGGLSMEGELTPANAKRYERKKAALQEQIALLQAEVERLKEERKATDRHIPISQLPEDMRFARLRTQSKHLIDTIKMIAYRAETSMAHVLREQLSRPDEARSLLREIYHTEADLLPNHADKTLTIRLHHLANHCSDAALLHLCSELNSTETLFPGTDLRLVYEVVSSQNP
jgi:transposase-like protein